MIFNTWHCNTPLNGSTLASYKYPSPGLGDNDAVLANNGAGKLIGDDGGVSGGLGARVKQRKWRGWGSALRLPIKIINYDHRHKRGLETMYAPPNDVSEGSGVDKDGSALEGLHESGLDGVLGGWGE